MDGSRSESQRHNIYHSSVQSTGWSRTIGISNRYLILGTYISDLPYLVFSASLRRENIFPLLFYSVKGIKMREYGVVYV